MEGYHSGCGSQLCRLGKKSAQTLDLESEYIWKDLSRDLHREGESETWKGACVNTGKLECVSFTSIDLEARQFSGQDRSENSKHH